VLEEAQKQDEGAEGAEGKNDMWVNSVIRDSHANVPRWKTIGDPDAPPPTVEPGLDALFKEIRVVVSQEAQIIKAVFPNPSVVMQVFLQRVFAQVVSWQMLAIGAILADGQIQQHIETLMSRASAISTLATLRLLQLTHSKCAALIEDLKPYDFALGNAAGSSKSAGATNSGPLALMLDQAMEEMFVPWLEGTRYLESESKNLVELYAGLLSRFTRYHVGLSRRSSVPHITHSVY
jgi:hypothetical protein